MNKNTWHLFCDESGISGKPYYAFGSLWIREDHIQEFETAMQALRTKHNCQDEIKWQAANSKRYSAFYDEIISYFFQADYLFFNCLSVQLSIVNKTFHDGDYEVAKQKHFTSLITNKIITSLSRNKMNRFIIIVDDLPFSYKKADESMHIIANNIIRQKTGVCNAILKLSEVDSKQSYGVQLCDLLLGAVLSVYQNDSSAIRKKELAMLVAEHLGWDHLKYDTFGTEKKFNIWNFYDPTKGPRITQTKGVDLKYPTFYSKK
ncbi:Protein of unknown function [Pasteurella testudinis DSM 23072]|uniref:DUF3800 domain-containing protein n=1 Tax=Pasteurella testudinis DSM 23072 TaxID=1122938 RepID=A0A1W1UML6_9PAST|nr:DUF3800 domain-containing protein [Pasteurella testudinis]SMB82378.1 Protein of unknown function [Pasteurella testudinis DSM 23072]SUB52229.1 Protein of uncharacterised function (DUF3800) [Pasteurella testudinis]